MKKEEENRILGPTGIKIKEAGKELARTMKLKPVGFHITKEKFEKWEGYKKMLKRQGININPDGGEHILKIAHAIDKTMLPIAKDLGEDPIKFSEDRLVYLLKEMRKTHHKKTDKLERVRTKAIESEDRELIENVTLIGP